MSVRTSRHLFCDITDGTGCRGWLDGPDDLPAAEMRADAARAGWTRVRRGDRTVDVCPVHTCAERGHTWKDPEVWQGSKPRHRQCGRCEHWESLP